MHNSRDTSRTKINARLRVIALCAGLSACAVPAVALAVTPKSGDYSVVAGQAGENGLTVSANKVVPHRGQKQIFVPDSYGASGCPNNGLSLPKSVKYIRIRNGRFTYHGAGFLYADSTKGHKVTVVWTGTWKTRAKVSGTVRFSSGHCKSRVIHWSGRRN
jgi:hypothetical protein